MKTVQFKTKTRCSRCREHEIAARIHRPTIEGVEIVRIRRDDLPDGFSAVYNCGKSIEEDKTEILFNFFLQAQWLAPTTPIARLAILNTERANAVHTKRILRRCPYDVFFEALDIIAQEEPIRPTILFHCEEVWHPLKPKNQYHTKRLTKTLMNLIRKHQASSTDLAGMFAVVLAYNHPETTHTLHQTVRNLLAESPGNTTLRAEIRYKLLSNLNMNIEELIEWGVATPEEIQSEITIELVDAV